MFKAISKFFGMICDLIDSGAALSRSAKAHAEAYEQETLEALTKATAARKAADSE